MDNLPTHEENPPTYDEATNKANNPPSYTEATTYINMLTTPNHTQPTSNFNIQQFTQDQNNADFSTPYSDRTTDAAFIVIIICLTLVLLLIFILI